MVQADAEGSGLGGDGGRLTVDLYYFCDEACQVTDPWFAVAGMAIQPGTIQRVLPRLKNAASREGKTGEVKWSNAKSYGGRVHRAYVDILFDLIEHGHAHFHIRFQPMAAYDHSMSGPRRKTDTVSKAYYQLLLHRAIRHYHNAKSLSIFPDDGECTAYLGNMLPGLRTAAKRKHANFVPDALKEIRPRSSAREPMLQLLDVTLGALAAYRNGRHTDPSISATKRELSQYVFERTGWPDIDGNCSASKVKLSRWNVTPMWERGR